VFVDITVKITPQMTRDAQGLEKKALAGHLGTHFDCMNKSFPLHYCKLPGVVYDVKDIFNTREIGVKDVDLSLVHKGCFVAFYTGWSDTYGYGTREYATDHPHLTHELIQQLVQKGAYIIGVDFVGVRRHQEHTPADRYCADRGTFIIENLTGLGALAGKSFTAYTFPMNYEGMSGIPCRVLAEL